jgi:hypothetical protein
LVKTYGKWPSFLVLLLATIQATAALAIVIGASSLATVSDGGDAG